MTPADAPQGVDVKLFPRPKGTGWTTWLSQHPTGAYWENRKVIRPRLILIHTNAGPTQANRDQIFSYAMQAQDNTKPTYQVDRDGKAYKFLPSDRQGIANYQADPFSISIETADLGSFAGPIDNMGFTDAQGETIAQIVAFEATLWDIPIETPVAWNGEGVASHTDPFTYPYWTKYQGKICPGKTKKLEVREWIMPRAREIQLPSSEEDELKSLFVAVTGSAGQYLWTPGSKPVPFVSVEQRDILLGALGLLNTDGTPKPGITLSQDQFNLLG